MKNERIISYNLSQKIGEDDLQQISAAVGSECQSAGVTYSPQTGWDVNVDAHADH
jgi:hypothetical protein